MMRNRWYMLATGSLLLMFACLNRTPQAASAKVMELYQQDLKELSEEAKQLTKLIEHKAAIQTLQAQFRKARAAYKKVEWLTEYYYPFTAKSLNGPALPEVEADAKTIVIPPEGFQVMEEMLFASEDPANMHAPLLQQAKMLQSGTGRLQGMAVQQETTDAHIFDALELEVFRIITLGITGFDSPIANNSLQEASVALQSIRDNLNVYKEASKGSEKNVGAALDRAIRFLSSSKNFNSFDRMIFITQYLNPVSRNIAILQRSLAVPAFTEPRLLKAGATTLFEKNGFNADFYTPGVASYSNPDKAALGEKLFYDGILSGDGKRSCATCHEPGKAFTDGLPTSFALDGKTGIRRNAPTLINAALQPALFYDMRVSYLEDQAQDVISNKDEMHGSLEDAVKQINNTAAYKSLFKKVYQDERASDLKVKNAIAAYIRSLVRMDSRFDQYMRGNARAMNQTEINGFNLFAGKAKCATCHFIPLFNGSNPPQFSKIDAEVIGVPAAADTLHAVLDSDEGKYNLYKIDLHKHAFKTPTIRNIELTAPYMHNGVYKTMEEVVEFYNRGGGAGLGLEISNQTLPDDKLHLSAAEKGSLIAFMKTLTDTCRSTIKFIR